MRAKLRDTSSWNAIGDIEMVSVIDVTLPDFYWSPILCEGLFYVVWSMSEY